MRALLRGFSSDDLLALAAMGGSGVCDAVEHELEQRAANGLVSRILRNARIAGRPAVRRPSGAYVAA